MSAIAATDKLFFERADAALAQDAATQIVEQALSGSDDGELFLEYRESEQISLDDGRIRCAGFDSRWGLACAPSRVRRPASPMPAKSPNRRCGGRPTASQPSPPGIPARARSRPGRPMLGCIRTPIRCG